MVNYRVITMRLIHNPFSRTPIGINLDHNTREALSRLLQYRAHIKDLSRGVYEEIRSGQREFLSFQHVEALMNELEDALIPILIER